MPERFLYLHGFASGPQSRKAHFFRERLAEHGRHLEIPSLDGGDFERLTIGGQLAVVERTLTGQSTVLIGSSLGGYLAALCASRCAGISRLVLLAPAFGFAERWAAVVGAEAMESWRARGKLAVHHHSECRMRDLGYGIVAESGGWEPNPSFRQPALIFHGLQDTVVPPEISVQFAAHHPNARLELLDSGHELTDVLNRIWTSARPFLLSEV